MGLHQSPGNLIHGKFRPKRAHTLYMFGPISGGHVQSVPPPPPTHSTVFDCSIKCQNVNIFSVVSGCEGPAKRSVPRAHPRPKFNPAPSTLTKTNKECFCFVTYQQQYILILTFSDIFGSNQFYLTSNFLQNTE